jgi:hypothetical protein
MGHVTVMYRSAMLAASHKLFFGGGGGGGGGGWGGGRGGGVHDPSLVPGPDILPMLGVAIYAAWVTTECHQCCGGLGG